MGKVINAPYNHIKTCMNTLNNISVIKKKIRFNYQKKERIIQSENKPATLMFRNYLNFLFFFFLSFSHLEIIARKYLENVLIVANIIGFADAFRIQFMLKTNDVIIQETMTQTKE